MPAFVLAAVGILALPVLLALFLAKSRLHWLFQALPILAIAFSLAWIGAFDLVLIVLVAAFSVLICANFNRYRQEQRKKIEGEHGFNDQPRFQLGLKDGLAVFVLLGLLTALLAKSIDANVWAGEPVATLVSVAQCLLIGIATAIWGTSLFMFRALKFRGRLVLLVSLTLGAVGAGWSEYVPLRSLWIWRWWLNPEDFSYRFGINSITKFQSILAWAVLLAAHALTVAVLVWLFRGRVDRKQNTELAHLPFFQRRMTVAGKRVIGSVLVLLQLSSLAYFYSCLLAPERYLPKRQTVSQLPNSFPDLVAAGVSLSNTGLSGYPPVRPGPKLAAVIETQSEIYQKIEIALDAENCFRIDWSSDHFDFTSNSSSELRETARALSMRALQSLSEGRHDDVIADGLLCFEVADRIAIDGILIDSLVATAIEGIGRSAAVSGIEGASADQLKKLVNRLDELFAACGEIDDEMDRLDRADDYFMSTNQSFHWLDLIHGGVFVGREESIEGIRLSLVRRNMFRDLLRTEIAIALYRLEFGQFPDNLESLVPKFMASVPDDLYSQDKLQPLKYVVSNDRDSYRLYSVGLDHDDDGGEVAEDWIEEGDIDLMILEGNRLAENAKEVAEHEEYLADQARLESEYSEDWEEGDYEEDYGDFFDEPEKDTPEQTKESD